MSTDEKFTYTPTGFRDLYWCGHLNEPVLIEWRDDRSYCVNCKAELLEDTDSHTFIAHVKKPE